MLISKTKSGHNKPNLSIIIPTYNESQNIINILRRIETVIPKNIFAQTIVVDDNSPDGTAKLVEEYINNIKKFANNTVDIIHRKAKSGLSSAILNGIKEAKGETIVVMDSDLSHPPQIILKMIDTFRKYQCDIVVASRYIKDGKIENWPLKRKIISKTATKITKRFLSIDAKDPLSGFFAFKRTILDGKKFDAIGYKLLLEIIVKTKGVNIKEIPYTFTDRQIGKSKLDFQTMTDYVKSVWRLYKSSKPKSTEKRSSVKFLSKAARFYTVGASGLAMNYLVSLFTLTSNPELWYLHANIFGIITSMTSNFLLNKIWTFNDRDFSPRKTISQYAKFLCFSSVGALVQLGMIYSLVDNYNIEYALALIVSVSVAAIGNFILNKKWTFKEKVWS